MAMAKASIERELECSICTDHFEDARFLSCLHSFCQKCLDGLAGDGSVVNCPLCRKETVMPAEGSTGLKRNLLANRMVDTIVQWEEHQQKLSDPQLPCDRCGEKDAIAAAYCSQCFGFICKDCSEAHDKFNLRSEGHRVFSLNELRSGNVKIESATDSQMCESLDSDHESKRQKATFYCESCKQAVCGNCGMLRHRDPNHHHTISIQDAVTSRRDKLQSVLDRCLEIEEQRGENLRELELKQEQVTTSLAVLERNIGFAFQQERRKLKENEDALTKKVWQIKCDIKTTLHNQRKSEEARISLISNIKGLSEDIIRKGKEQEVLSVYEPICDEVKTLRLDDIDPRNLLTSLERVSRFTSEIRFEGISDLSAASSRQGDLAYPADWQQILRKQRSNPMKEPSSVISLPDGTIAIGYASGGNIEKYDLQGNLCGALVDKAVQDMALMPDGHSFAILDTKRNIRVLSGGKVLPHSFTSLSSGTPQSLTTDSLGNIIVLYDDRVEIFSPTGGTPTKTIPLDLSEQPSQIQAIDSTNFLIKDGFSIKLIQLDNWRSAGPALSPLCLTNGYPDRKCYGIVDSEGNLVVAALHPSLDTLTVDRFVDNNCENIVGELAVEVGLGCDICITSPNPSQIVVVMPCEMFVFQRNEQCLEDILEEIEMSN